MAGFSATRVYRGVTYHIDVRRVRPGNGVALVADGSPVAGTCVPFRRRAEPRLTSRCGLATDRLDTRGRFVIRDFQEQRPFASFLPGIAGPLGIPIWAFYVNRGQGIASFGIENKDGAIVEFQPANKAYQTVSYTGFRTFLRVARDSETRNYEPFGVGGIPRPAAERHMAIGMNEFEIVETDPDPSLRVSVLYFVLPGESFPGLVRQVTLENTGDRALDLELLDGLPQIVPYGATNALLKDMSRTLEAWMEVTNIAQGIPYYRLRTMAGDETEVEELTGGFFYVAWAGQSGRPCRCSWIRRACSARIPG